MVACLSLGRRLQYIASSAINQLEMWQAVSLNVNTRITPLK